MQSAIFLSTNEIQKKLMNSHTIYDARLSIQSDGEFSDSKRTRQNTVVPLSVPN